MVSLLVQGCCVQPSSVSIRKEIGREERNAVASF